MFVDFSCFSLFLGLLILMEGTTKVLVPLLWRILVASSLFDDIFEGIDTDAHAGVHLSLHALQMVLHKVTEANDRDQRLVSSI